MTWLRSILNEDQIMSEKIAQSNEEVFKGQFRELVQGSVKEALNKLLEAEAEKVPGASKEQPQEYCSGH